MFEPKEKTNDRQAALVSLASDEEKNLDSKAAGEGRTEDLVSTEYVGQRSEVVESVAHQMNKLSVCTTPRLSIPPSVSTESSNPGGPGLDLDKKIRALKKKVNSLHICHLVCVCFRTLFFILTYESSSLFLTLQKL